MEPVRNRIADAVFMDDGNIPAIISIILEMRFRLTENATKTPKLAASYRESGSVTLPDKPMVRYKNVLGRRFFFTRASSASWLLRLITLW